MGIGMTGGGWLVAERMLLVWKYDMGAGNIHLRCAALTACRMEAILVTLTDNSAR